MYFKTQRVFIRIVDHTSRPQQSKYMVVCFISDCYNWNKSKVIVFFVWVCSKDLTLFDYFFSLLVEEPEEKK